jgi:hypothetical protein
MDNNLKPYLDKLKSKGFPIYKAEKELKIGNGFLGKIASGYRIMTNDILRKITPYIKEKLGEDFVYENFQDEGEMKCIPMEEWKEIEAIIQKVRENNEPKNKERIEKERNTPHEIKAEYPSIVEEEYQMDSSDVEAQIKAIRAEKIPTERNTHMGRKIWQLEQDKKIAELKNKLQ